MKKLLFLMVLSCFILSFCISKPDKNYTLAFIKEICINKGELEKNNGEKEINNFVGIFPKSNDTINIFKLDNEKNEKPEMFSFWIKKKNSQSITFYCSEEEVKVTFSNRNNINVNNDTYTVNNEYYIFLKQKILAENSIMDLTFFLKDGYGDYAQSLEPLNKNWRNLKENNAHKIISAKIKNKNFQTNAQFFNYKFNYKYSKNGTLQSISGENSFNKSLIKENSKFLIYSIDRSLNERATDTEYLYKNKKTLFDSIVGNREKYSNATTYFYTKYQSKLKQITVNYKPRSVKEIIKSLGLNKNEFE